MELARPSRRAVLAAPLALVGCGRGEGIAVPFEEAHPHLVLDMQVDGRPARALLDNGAPVSVIHTAFAAPGAELRQARLTVGRASIPAYPLIQDLSHVADVAEQGIDAMLGMELFLRFIVAFDFVGKVMRLHGPTGFSAPQGALRLPLKRKGYRNHTVEVAAGSAPPAQAVVDLGCSTPLLLSRAFAEKHGLTAGRTISHRMAPVFAASGMQQKLITTFTLPSLSFAGRTFREIPVDVMPDEAGPFTGLDLVLGAPILNRFDLAMDLVRNRIWTRPNARQGEPFIRRTVGLSVVVEPGGLRVLHVAEGSPAEAAELKAGPLLTRIDGKKASRAALRTAVPGQVLELELDGRERRKVTAGYYY